jgi:predicted small metal-binding protein
MDKILDCRDVGIDCDYRVCTSTESETIQKMGEHIQALHGMKGFSKEFYRVARKAVYKGICDSQKDCFGGVCRL